MLALVHTLSSSHTHHCDDNDSTRTTGTSSEPLRKSTVLLEHYQNLKELSKHTLQEVCITQAVLSPDEAVATSRIQHDVNIAGNTITVIICI